MKRAKEIKIVDNRLNRITLKVVREFAGVRNHPLEEDVLRVAGRELADVVEDHGLKIVEDRVLARMKKGGVVGLPKSAKKYAYHLMRIVACSRKPFERIASAGVSHADSGIAHVMAMFAGAKVADGKSGFRDILNKALTHEKEMVRVAALDGLMKSEKGKNMLQKIAVSDPVNAEKAVAALFGNVYQHPETPKYLEGLRARLARIILAKTTPPEAVEIASQLLRKTRPSEQFMKRLQVRLKRQ